MQRAEIPLLSLAQPTAALAPDLGASFRRYGFAMVTDHGIDADLIAKGWRLAADFFALSETEKLRYHIAGGAGQRGYTPFGREIAKGAQTHDLKEFWHVGRDMDAHVNLWPERPQGFKATFTRLFDAFDVAGARLLAAIALDLGLAEDWFAPAIVGGNSVLRLLHYPPVDAGHGNAGAIRAGAHEDINLITLLLGAEESGLELLNRDGEWLELAPPPHAMVVNIGDMLQRLTNHVLPSTTHRVRNPAPERARFSRYSMPFFLHPRPDFLIETLPQCVSTENPDHFPVAIPADDYLQERLRDIGLRI